MSGAIPLPTTGTAAGGGGDGGRRRQPRRFLETPTNTAHRGTAAGGDCEDGEVDRGAARWTEGDNEVDRGERRPAATTGPEAAQWVEMAKCGDSSQPEGVYSP
jgi:hypothetical protein